MYSNVRNGLPYRLLFHHAHEAFIVFKPKGEIILDVNKKATETYGYSRDEMIGMSVETFTKDISKGKSHIKDTLNKEYQHEFESIHFHKNGNEIYLHITGSVIEYNNEKVILSINRDITEKKEAEMSLKQEHQTLKAILNNQSIYVLKTDIQGNYTYVNDYFCERFLIDRADTIGKSGMTHIIPEDHEKCIQIAEKCIAHPNHPFEVTLRKPSPDGEVFNTEWNFTAIASADGVPYEIVAVGYDTTNHEKGKIKLSALAHHSTNALIFTGNTNIIEYTNPTFNSLFSNKGEVVGKDLNEVFPQDDLSKIKEISVTINGKQRYFTVKHSKIKNLDRTTGKLYSLSDITPLKLEQEFVKRSNYAILELSTQSILKDLSLDDYYNKLLKSARELFNVASCNFWKIDLKSKLMTLLYSSQKGSKASRVGTTIAFEQAPGYFKSIINDKILSVDDTGLNERTQLFLDEYIGQYNVRALLGVQVVEEADILGIFCMESSSPRKWTNEEKTLATNFAILLENAFANNKIQQAREEIAKLSLVASQVHNSVVITDAKGRVDWVNDAFYTLTGYTLKEIKGKTLGKILQGRDTNPEDKEKIKEWLKCKEPFTQEILNYTKTGKPYWNELSVTPIFNEEGVLTQYFGIQNNITKRKQYEAEIEKLSLVASNTQNAVVITDINGCSVWVNDSFLSLSGYSKTEVLGKKPGELLQGPDTDPQHVEKIRSGLADRIPFTQEILNYNKKNEPYWIELSINPIFDKKGNLIQFIGIQNDISDRKKKEYELEKALEEKNTLFKELHHRVKNNLNMVSNLLYLKSNNTNDYRLIEFIKETTNRISSISKTHDQLLKLEEINQLFIKDYVQGLVENLIYSYSHDTKRYQVEYSIEDMELHVDKVLTIGLLTNEIILNTIKHAYSEEQTGVIYIDIQRKNNQVIYTIGDKGKGMKEEQLAFNNSLGLQLIKMFVLQLDGELEMDTANGVQYCIKFPFR